MQTTSYDDGQATSGRDCADRTLDQSDSGTNDHFVTIVMPALNEERYIAQAISSILPPPDEAIDQGAADTGGAGDAYPAVKNALACELLVMDGGSTDRTREIVQEMSARDPRIRLIANPKKVQSAAVNLAAREADPRSRCLVRADCHAVYPENYAADLLTTLRRENVSSVVVAMRTCGTSCFQKGIAAAQNSRLGNGGSAHRILGKCGLVDHGHHAAFDREAFLTQGGYDENCAFNEDAEFDQRLIKTGGTIYLNGNIAIDYYPRDSLFALARQYANHGWGRANTFLRHGGRPKLRQVLPVLILAACLGAVLLTLLTFNTVFLLIPAGYFAAATAFGLLLAYQTRCACTSLAGPAAIVMHMSWATGFAKRVMTEAWARVRGNKTAAFEQDQKLEAFDRGVKAKNAATGRALRTS
ncbi:MAG: glycosyltransferase family 2 protein [Pseudomonadota bacterium]